VTQRSGWGKRSFKTCRSMRRCSLATCRSMRNASYKRDQLMGVAKDTPRIVLLRCRP
jgi:hypothetical protein